MLLSDVDLNRAIGDGQLRIDPLPPDSWFQPASIELSLGSHFVQPYARELIGGTMAPLGTNGIRNALAYGSEWTADTVTLEPGEFLLATTRERVYVGPGLAARVEGKSSIGRRGLFVHVTAGFIDPGFEGDVTLELYNAAPVSVTLTTGQKIAQLCVFELTSRSARPYGSEGLGSHYQGQSGTTRSRS